MLVCVSVEAVAVAEVAEVKDNILESSYYFKKKKKNATRLKAFKGLWEGEEVSAVAFLWKRYFPLQNKTRTDNRFPKKPVSVTVGERCASPPNV